MLKAPVELARDASPEFLERQRKTEEFKAHIIEYVESGHTLAETVADMDRILREERTGRAAAEREMRRLIREGDGEAVRAFVATQNEVFRAKGLRELTLPAHLRTNNELEKTE